MSLATYPFYGLLTVAGWLFLLQLHAQTLTVIDFDSGSAIEAATVEILTTSRRSNPTNRFGKTRLPVENMPPKPYRLLVRREGYFNQDSITIRPLADGKWSLPATIVLKRKGPSDSVSLYGIIRDYRNILQPNAMVRLNLGGYWELRDTSDENGQFEFKFPKDTLIREIKEDSILIRLQIRQAGFELLDIRLPFYFRTQPFLNLSQELRRNLFFVDVRPVSVFKEKDGITVDQETSHEIEIDPEKKGFRLLNVGGRSDRVRVVLRTDSHSPPQETEIPLDQLRNGDYIYQMRRNSLRGLLLSKEMVLPGMGRWKYLQKKNRRKKPIHLAQTVLVDGCLLSGIVLEIWAGAQYRRYINLGASSDNVEQINDLRTSIDWKQDARSLLLVAGATLWLTNMIYSYLHRKDELSIATSSKNPFLQPKLHLLPGQSAQFGLVFSF